MSFSLLGYRLFLLSRYRKVKGYRPAVVVTIDYSFITVSHPSITAGHEGKPSGKREFFLLLMSLLLYFYSKHLECSVVIYSVLQDVLFVELPGHINEISGILQIVRKF